MSEEPDDRSHLLFPVPYRQRLRRAVPSLSEILIGGPVWALWMALSAWHALWLREHDATFHLQSVLYLYALGGFIAWPLALSAARYVARDRAVETRFAAFLLCLAVGTVATTGFLFCLDYRMFYSQWHAAAGSRMWFFQFIVTSVSAFYQFLVLGLRLYLPLGAIALVLASLWLARDGERRARLSARTPR